MNRENPKSICILGSTGSIGKSALDVVRHLKGEIVVKALAAKGNIDLLYAQALEFSPEIIAVYDESKALELQKKLPTIKVVGGMEGLKEVSSYPGVELVLSAITGSIGIVPTVAAIEAGKHIALANKEVLVAAGGYVTELAKQKGVPLLPVDSEHSALFQCLQGEKRESVSRLILTASGGPFFRHTREMLHAVTLEEALKHPTWNMGAKITIDSSTLMNKGLEVIEAHYLFDIPVAQIDVVIHPQSVIHSMVEFVDGSMIAQLSQPNMILPIQYAFTYPERKKGLLPPFDFSRYPSLEFIKAEKRKFICLDLAFEALRQGGSMPCYLNAANEVLVERFLDKKIGWIEISQKLEKLLSSHKVQKQLDLDAIFAIDASARQEAQLI